MKKSIFEQMGDTYHQERAGLLLESDSVGIGGQRRRQYLKAQCNAIYMFCCSMVSETVTCPKLTLRRKLYFFS